MTWYHIAKDFSGPLATVIAATVVAVVTWVFQSRQFKIAKQQTVIAAGQKNIAEAQRDIAYDKLKHDLFNKRYEIYSTAKALIKHICEGSFERKGGNEEVRESFIKLDEARFFFPDTETALFLKIVRLVSEHETARYRHNHSSDDAVRKRHGDEAAKLISELADIYAALPQLMERELGFSQLTTRPRNNGG